MDNNIKNIKMEPQINADTRCNYYFFYNYLIIKIYNCVYPRPSAVNNFFKTIPNR